MEATRTIHVLHVDDDSNFVDMAARFLKREDDRFRVMATTDSQSGLEYLAENACDCIVSDYDMPGKSGIELLETVREEYPDLPFILFTGRGSEEVASEAISKGVTDYLQKKSGTDRYTILANRIRNYVERRRVQRAQEIMRERMELALDYTDSVIFEIDLDTGVVTRFGNFEHFFAHTPDDVPTWEDHLEQAVHPADRDKFREFHEQLAAGERESGTLEYRTNPDKGEVRWIRDTVYVENEASKQAIGLAQDITDQKKQEQRREQIIDRVTDAIVEVDSEWRFTLVNDQAEELYGLDEEQLLGQSFWEVFSDARGTRFEREYRQVMETREPTSFIEYYSGLDGRFDIHVYPNDDGGIAFYFRELTDSAS